MNRGLAGQGGDAEALLSALCTSLLGRRRGGERASLGLSGCLHSPGLLHMSSCVLHPLPSLTLESAVSEVLPSRRGSPGGEGGSQCPVKQRAQDKQAALEELVGGQPRWGRGAVSTETGADAELGYLSCRLAPPECLLVWQCGSPAPEIGVHLGELSHRCAFPQVSLPVSEPSPGCAFP